MDTELQNEGNLLDLEDSLYSLSIPEMVDEEKETRIDNSVKEIIRSDSNDHPINSYVVAAGDTIEGISLRTGVSISNLQRINRIYGKHVYVGQVLSLDVPKRPPMLPPVVKEQAKTDYSAEIYIPSNQNGNSSSTKSSR